MLASMRWLLALVAALFVLVTTPAFAQSLPSPPAAKPSPADEATAKRNFESGLKLYGEGSYAEALIAFEQSYRLGGRPSALKNIAQCHRNLKHFVEAHEAYEQMLALHDAQLSAADKTAVKQALDELGVLTGTIEVTVNETGADIEIDGRSVGKSPMAKPKRVKVDPHTVRVSKAGFDPFEQQVNVGSQEQKKIDVKLLPEKTTAHLVVREQSGREAHAFVDGKDVGAAPWEGDVDAGDHTIEVKGARFASEPRKIHVASKERLDLALDATPLLGRLRVTTVPATASIRIDGNAVGAGAWEGELPEGQHRIEVALGSEAPQVRDVLLSRGQLVVQEIPVVSAIALSTTSYNGIYLKFSLGGMLGIAGNASNAVGPASPGQAEVQDNGSFIGQSDVALRIGDTFGEIWSLEGVGIFMFEHRDHQYHYSPGAGSSDPKFDFRDESNMVNGFLGAGGRVTSKGETVRFTFGLAPGLSIRAFSPQRHCDGSNCGNNGGSNPGGTGNPGGSNNRFVPSGVSSPSGPSGGCGTGGSCSNNNDISFNNAGYTTFGFVTDGGVLFGSTPGAKFFLGVQTWIDFPPSIVVGPDTFNSGKLPDGMYARPGRGVVVIDGPQFYFGPVIGLQFGH